MERPRRSFASPPYASDTAENAAVAFHETLPHSERIPPEEKSSPPGWVDDPARGEDELRIVLTRGEGVRGGGGAPVGV